MSRHHRSTVRGVAWHRLRLAVFKRDGHLCRVCGLRGRILECDHIIPLAEGGESVMSNLQTLCRDCHMEKTWRENGNDIRGRGEWGAYATASRFAKARP